MTFKCHSEFDRLLILTEAFDVLEVDPIFKHDNFVSSKVYFKLNSPVTDLSVCLISFYSFFGLTLVFNNILIINRWTIYLSFLRKSVLNYQLLNMNSMVEKWCTTQNTQFFGRLNDFRWQLLPLNHWGGQTQVYNIIQMFFGYCHWCLIFPIEKYILSTKGYNLFYVTLLVWVKTDVSAYGITHNKRSKMCVFQNG